MKGSDDIKDQAFNRGFGDQGSGGTWMVIFNHYPQTGLISPNSTPSFSGPNVSEGGEDAEEKSTPAWYSIKDA